MSLKTNQEPILKRIEVFRDEIAELEFVNDNCPLLKSQLQEALVLLGAMGRRVEELMETMA